MEWNILYFFLGLPNKDGQSLAQIIRASDCWWEQCHHHIQWVFPLKEPSRFNPDAPLLDDETVAALRTPLIQEVILKSYRRFLRFLGFATTTKSPKVLKNFKTFEKKSAVWGKLGNHNLLRITRCLKFLCIVGLKEHAYNFYDALLENGFVDGPEWQETLNHWYGAVHEPQKSLPRNSPPPVAIPSLRGKPQDGVKALSEPLPCRRPSLPYRA